MKREVPIPSRNANDREQISRILRFAFPLGSGSFSDLPIALRDKVWSRDAPRNHAIAKLGDGRDDGDG